MVIGYTYTTFLWYYYSLYCGFDGEKMETRKLVAIVMDSVSAPAAAMATIVWRLIFWTVGKVGY